MDSIWTILGLDPTEDVSAIKRAYAEKAKSCHPEEDPEGFLRLRKAYQAALEYAEKKEGVPQEAEELPAELDAAPLEDQDWTLSDRPIVLDEGPNPFENHEAIQSFLDLYTGKQRKDSKRWLDYFTSGAFLDAAWERRFTALLLAHVVRLEGEGFPVNREFLIWLCAAYQFLVDKQVYRNPDGSEWTEFNFQISTDAQFEGQEFIFDIARKGSAPRQAKGVEQAVRSSFAEYRGLVRMAEVGSWDEGTLKQAGSILDFYMLSNFQDKNPTGSERHPAGMRLIEHFFRRNDLPKELYHMAWQKLELKTALMGRAKLLYGGLRERVLEQIPNIAQGELNIRQLNKEFEEYRQSVRALEGTGKPEDWARAEAETKAFFARADFQQALWNRRFAEEHMKYHVQWSGSHFVQEILTFYQRHPNAPCAEQLTLLIAETSRRREIERRNQEDIAAPAGKPALEERPFFRHWLNTGFYHAQDRDTGRALVDYLSTELPYLPAWSRGFLEVKDGEIPVPVPVTCALGGDTIEVRFHLRYMEFLWNREQVYRPCLPWERVATLADTDTFFFLLPITIAVYDQYEPVKAEILRRLSGTAAPEDGRETIAACLADQVCALPPPDAAGLAPPDFDEDGEPLEAAEPLPPESVLPFEVFAENEDILYVCVWFQRERILALYQQTPYGKQAVRGEQYNEVPDAQAAVTLARQLLQEQLFPKGLPMEALKDLPDAVYVRWDYAVAGRDKDIRPLWSTPVELLGESVTIEKLEDLLTQFGENRVERLEWSWKSAIPVGEEQGYEPRRSLVFLKDGGKYVCLYFNDFRAESYALLEKPELYGKGNDSLQRVPFRRSRLFQQVIHHNFTTIRRKLDMVFSQVSGNKHGKFMAGPIWDHAENVSHGRGKYNLDKQLLGDFPMERAYNRLDAPFYFSCYPESAALAAGEGGTETLKVTELNRPRLQQQMVQFMQGGGSKLRLTWGREEGRRRHIVLLQDGGRFQMAWVQEEKQTVQFHVSDVSTYMNVEGKKYPKDTFQGRVTPAYLIHDPIPLRNALDLLLACIESPELITGQFAEYASEKPVKTRPYEALWSELVGGTV